MIFKKDLAIICLLVVTIMPRPALATGIPVLDISNLIQSVFSVVYEGTSNTNEIEQINYQIQQLQEAVRTYNQLVDTYDVLTGKYGYGDLFNQTVDQAARRWAPEGWEDSVGGQAWGTYKTYRDYYNARYPAYALKDIFPHYPQSGSAALYEEMEGSINATAAVAQTGFKGVQKRIQTIERLTKEIEKTDGIKASSDLGNRINSELGFAVADLTKVTAAMTQNQGLIARRTTESMKSKADFLNN